MLEYLYLETLPWSHPLTLLHTPHRYKKAWQAEATNAQLASNESQRLSEVAEQLERELRDVRMHAATSADEARASAVALQASREELKKLSDEHRRKCDAVIALESSNQQLVGVTLYMNVCLCLFV